jgi:hypothetical protein
VKRLEHETIAAERNNDIGGLFARILMARAHGGEGGLCVRCV